MRVCSKKRASCLIDSSSTRQLLIVLLLIGSVSAQAVQSGQLTTTVKKELKVATTAAAAAATTTTPATEPSPGSIEPISEQEVAQPMLELAEDRSAADTGLLPDRSSLFSKDAVMVEPLDHMDCHLRNMDYCYAGMLAASAKVLPETDAELEVRCDELRAATSCLALYNRRCHTLKVFSMLLPMGSTLQMPEQVAQMRAPLDIGQAEPEPEPGAKGSPVVIKLGDLANVCSPQAKRDKANKQLRERLFRLARCINQRMPVLTPCLEDLKAALQLFYEPRRALPLKPTCCALSKFRNCSMGALDNVCGFSSFRQVESSLMSAGPGSMLKIVERVCGQGSSHFESAYCQEVLPPSGMKVPQRRGHRASKLAKALDLISFAPAVQQP